MPAIVLRKPIETSVSEISLLNIRKNDLFLKFETLNLG